MVTAVCSRQERLTAKAFSHRSDNGFSDRSFAAFGAGAVSLDACFHISVQDDGFNFRAVLLGKPTYLLRYEG